MAYAPYCNSKAFSPSGEQVKPIILGRFREKDYGLIFEYSERMFNDTELFPEYPHIIYVGHGEQRYGKVLKTVAYVLVDEDKVEKWYIKGHKDYGVKKISEEEMFLVMSGELSPEDIGKKRFAELC